MNRNIKSCLFCGNIFVLLFTVGLHSIFAQIPPNYYLTASGKSGKALQCELSNIIDNHVIASYYSLWQYFLITDTENGNEIFDLYSSSANANLDNQFVWNVDQCVNIGGEEGVCYNREHIFCQSWFGGGEDAQYSDLFHIYPVDGYINSIRNNNPFGVVNNPTRTFNNGSKFGANSYVGAPSSSAFEPIDELKGDIARTFFYMATRYLFSDSQFLNSEMTEKSQLLPWAVNMLLDWHYNDPVSQKEIDRNAAVYMIQHNRNPFIDYPELVGKIWDDDSVNAFQLSVEPSLSRVSISYFSLVDEHTLKLCFSQPIVAYSAENLLNFQLGGSTSINNAAYDEDTLVLTIGGVFQENAIYFLNVNNILGVNQLFMNDTLLPFVYTYVQNERPIISWTFNDLASKPNTSKQIDADLHYESLDATLFCNSLYGSSDFNSEIFGNELDAMTGTILGLPNSENAIAGNAIVFANTSANGKKIVLKIETLGFYDISLTFAIRRTGTGFNIHQWEWSENGEEYYPLTNVFTVPSLTAQFEVVTVDLSQIPAANNASMFFLRLQLDGASSSTGNNRVDNIVVYGVDMSAGIDRSSDHLLDFNIYPNPVQQIFMIEIVNSYSLNYEKLYCKIYNISGQLVGDSFIQDGQQQISVMGLKSGIYFVELEGLGVGKSVKKIVICE